MNITITRVLTILSRDKLFFSYTRKMSAVSVYVTRPNIPKPALDMLKEKGYELTIWPKDVPVPREELLKNVANKTALFCLLTDKIDAQVLDKAGPALKIVSTMSVGYDHLDVNEIKKRNILIGYTPGVLTDAVAELTVGLLLATSRRLFESHHALMNDEWTSWSPTWMCGPGLKDKVIGIVGFGRIGQEVARLLKPFKVSSFLYTSRTDKEEAKEFKGKRVELDELLKNSDFVILTCALTPDTEKLFNKAAFAKMKPTAIFINTSRGGLVDQDDLIAALKNHTIRAAGLDVMTPEPLPSSHPLLKLQNCVVIPHIGSASIETRLEMAKLAARNIIAAVENKPLPAQV